MDFFFTTYIGGKQQLAQPSGNLETGRRVVLWGYERYMCPINSTRMFREALLLLKSTLHLLQLLTLRQYKNRSQLHHTLRAALSYLPWGTGFLKVFI